MSKFIIASDSLSKDDRDALTKLLQAKPWGFAHWIEHVWLLAGVPDQYTAKRLWEEIVADLPACEPKGMLVTRINAPVSYWGRGNDSNWKWMAEYWGDPR